MAGAKITLYTVVPPVEASWVAYTFGDLALSALVVQVLRYNTDILTAWAQVEE